MARPTLIKTLVMILPVGTVILGGISFAFFIRAEEAKRAPSTNSKFAVSLRKDIAQEDIERYVRTLADTLGPRSAETHDVLEAAASYIESTLGTMNMGYGVERQTYEIGGKAFHNLVAELPGGKLQKEIIVVGAHYDTAGPTPGADDNASGVAALLAIAHAMTGTENARTIRFVAFTNEEPPYYHTADMGSRVYVKRCISEGDRILGMLSLESLGYFDDKPGSQRYPPGIDAKAAGYPDTGNFIAVVGNVTSKRLVDGIVEFYRPASKVPAIGASLPPLIPWVNASDHSSFWQEDIPAVMITDTAPLRNPHYHKATDTPETLDFARLTEVAKGLEAAIRRLANPKNAP